MQEETQLDYQNLADLINLLAEESLIPDNTNCAAPSQGGDIDFSKDTWVASLLNVQIWIGLDSFIPMNANPYEALTEIYGHLCRDHIDGLLIGNEQLPNEKALELLEDRLEIALEFKEEFEIMTETIDLQAASTLWKERWDNLHDQDFSNTITAKVDTWKFSEFLGLLDDNELVINPTYQRDDVWSVGDARDLIKSILRGIPLPAIILYEQEIENNDGVSSVYQIVDGKQRLTSILRFLGKHPYVTEYVEKCDQLFPNPSNGILPSKLFHSNYKQFLSLYVTKNTHTKITDAEKSRFKKYAPFALQKFPKASKLGKFSGKYYHEIKQVKTPNGDSLEKIFTKSNPVYKLPVILFEKTNIRDIHDVFGIYNKKGKTLNADEVRNAIFHHLHLAKLLLVLSGDRLDKQTKLASYLGADLTASTGNTPSKLNQVNTYLSQLGFGTSRFRKTKVLSWVTAILFLPPKTSLRNGKNVYTTPATAKHIDSLFTCIDENSSHPLCKIPKLNDLADVLVESILLHKELQQHWSVDFRSKRKDGKWEELPVVASLLFCVLMVLAGEQDKMRTTIKVESNKHLTGPESTQNETQWGHISSCVVHLLSVMGYTSESAKLIELRKKIAEKFDVVHTYGKDEHAKKHHFLDALSQIATNYSAKSTNS